MIPDYCAPDLAQTGGPIAAILTLALAAAVIGGAIVARKRRGALAALLLLALVPALVALPGRADASARTQCPEGYHYVAQKGKTVTAPAAQVDAPSSSSEADKPAPEPEPAPAPRPRSDADESWMTPRTTFTLAADGSTGRTASGEDLVNWDIAKKTLRAYMNADKNGIADKNSSPYITDVTAIASEAADRIAAACTAAVSAGKKPAAVFDADDTTLWTYDMEDGSMHFNFTPAKQQAWFDANRMPATPGMVDLVKKVSAAGCTIIGLTGRAANQQAYTIQNLTDAGYVDGAGDPLFTDANYYTKFLKTDPMPAYLAAQGRCDVAKNKCTTVQFKAGTRQYLIEDLGYDIVGNFGDQWSDLQGGYADNWIKLPNATYYLPSPDFPETQAGDNAAGMAPPVSTYTVLPDGSSGSAPGVVDSDIPNMDIVKATIRAYYDASMDSGLGHYVSNKTASPYISELTKITSKAKEEVVAACEAAVAAGERPAITLDADDTTLWTYDMEEWLEFNFSPALQTQYLKTDYHALPATPGMVDLVTAAKAAGCEPIGLTGRSDDLRDVTLRNLAEVGYPAFNKYFTKASSYKADLPSWMTCAGEKCTTIEFKSSVRKHIENDLGYRIVGNFGDQYSDLIGGYADVAYKLPNPTYYLP